MASTVFRVRFVLHLVGDLDMGCLFYARTIFVPRSNHLQPVYSLVHWRWTIRSAATHEVLDRSIASLREGWRGGTTMYTSSD